MDNPNLVSGDRLAEERLRRNEKVDELYHGVRQVDKQSFQAQDKRKCVERELRFRYRIYANRICNGQLSFDEAIREIACMEAIAADYR